MSNGKRAGPDAAPWQRATHCKRELPHTRPFRTPGIALVSDTRSAPAESGSPGRTHGPSGHPCPLCIACRRHHGRSSTPDRAAPHPAEQSGDDAARFPKSATPPQGVGLALCRTDVRSCRSSDTAHSAGFSRRDASGNGEGKPRLRGTDPDSVPAATPSKQQRQVHVSPQRDQDPSPPLRVIHGVPEDADQSYDVEAPEADLGAFRGSPNSVRNLPFAHDGQPTTCSAGPRRTRSRRS